jgi:hypothetical protein
MVQIISDVVLFGLISTDRERGDSRKGAKARRGSWQFSTRVKDRAVVFNEMAIWWKTAIPPCAAAMPGAGGLAMRGFRA